MPRTKIAELERKHLAAASGIFAAAYRLERKNAPILDECFGTAAAVLPKLESCLGKNPGVAALDGSRLVGYMTGFYIDRFLSPHRGAYSPEWAHGSVGEGAFETYRLMYREMARRWVDAGCLAHAVNIMSHARDAQDAFIWNGFGGICFDAMRQVDRMNAKAPHGIRITPVKKEDVPVWLPMVEASARHLAESPSFIPHPEPENSVNLLHFLGQPGNFAWMAWQGDDAVGYMQAAPVGSGAAWVVNGERKFAINGAYVKPECRGKGIAKALLSEVMDWGAEKGFVRCSVDFEATNPEACRFWLRHFTPVCRSLVRRLDSRIINVD